MHNTLLQTVILGIKITTFLKGEQKFIPSLFQKTRVSRGIVPFFPVLIFSYIC